MSALTAHHETAVRIGREIALAVGLALSQPAVAAPPDSVDPALAPWFESLKQPGTGAPCCSIADCRTVEFRQDRDGYEVLIEFFGRAKRKEQKQNKKEERGVVGVLTRDRLFLFSAER